MDDTQLRLEADWDEFCRLERQVSESEVVAIRARWECGHKLLGYEKRSGSKASPLAQVVAKLKSELGVGKTELYDRRTFADLYPTEQNLSDASESFGSWHEIVKNGLRERGQGSTPPLPTSDYRCITIDPPWPIEKIVREVRPAQTAPIDYPTMTITEIDELVGQVVKRQNGCHVYLWTTHRFIRDAFDLFDSWNVNYECLMTWVKNVGPTPFSWMYDTEHVLFGRRGSLALEQQGLRLSFQAPAVGHSVKPDVFYERVVAASPGPRLAMFERNTRDGFEVWGDEIAA